MGPERAQAIECETRSQELGWDLEEGVIAEATHNLSVLWFSISRTANLVGLWGKGAMIVDLIITHVI